MGCASSKTLVERERNNQLVENIFHSNQNNPKDYAKPSVPIVLDPRTTRPSTAPSTPPKNQKEDIPKRPIEEILEDARTLVREIKPSADIDDVTATEKLKYVNEEEFCARIAEAAQRKRPKRPGIPEVIGGSCSELTVSWPKSPSNVDRYEVLCTRDDVTDRQVAGTVDGSRNELTIRNLAAGTEYEIEVVAVTCEDAVVLRSKAASGRFSTGAYFNGGIRIKEIAKNSVTVKWEPAIGQFDTYSVVHQGPDGVEVEDAYLDAQCTHCKIDGLEAHVTYTVTVRVTCFDSPVKGDESSVEVIIDGMCEDRDRLKGYIETVINKDETGLSVVVDRSKPILEQCKGHYMGDKNEMLRGRPEVEFRDSKQTCDLGGPRREFFSLLMEGVMAGYQTLEDDEDDDVMLIFEGEMDHKILVHDDVLLSKEIFRVAGKMVQHSVMWGGPGLVGIAQSVKDYIRTGSQYEIVLDVCDIPDMEIREVVQKIIDSKGRDLEDVGKSEECVNMLKDAGILNTTVNDENKHVIVQELLLHNIIRKRQRELDQFRQGFDSLSLAKEHPGACDVVFPKQADSVVKYCDISRLVQFDKKDSSEKKLASKHFTRYLQECERRQDAARGAVEQNSISLSKVLAFITGCPVLPPRSYGKIKIKFHSHTLPIAETCFQLLHIPMEFDNYETFRDCMDNALAGSEGFGLT